MGLHGLLRDSFAFLYYDWMDQDIEWKEGGGGNEEERGRLKVKE
jgi:hypothetical protein